MYLIICSNCDDVPIQKWKRNILNVKFLDCRHVLQYNFFLNVGSVCVINVIFMLIYSFDPYKDEIWAWCCDSCCLIIFVGLFVS